MMEELFDEEWQRQQYDLSEKEYNLKLGRAEGLAQGIKRGMAQGMAQGKDIGAYETILDLVRKKLISIKVAAEQLGMTEKDFCEKAGIQKEQ